MSQILNVPIGIYEKALPGGLSWAEKFQIASETGFDYIEMSLDPSEERLARLAWTPDERRAFRQISADCGISVHSLCLSAHRAFPLGDPDPVIRARGLDILRDAINLAADLNIRIVQFAGYDTRGEPSTAQSQALYRDGLRRGVGWAAARGVLLGLENQEIGYIDSPTMAAQVCADLGSAYLGLYMDIGNIIVQGRDLLTEIPAACGRLFAVHVKDARPGVPRHIPFGEGDVPFDQAFALLVAGGYSGPILIEMWNEDKSEAVRIVETAREFIEEKLIHAFQGDVR